MCSGSHLLLVFPLRVEASLDALPGLLEGLPLGALGGVMSAHSHDVGAREDQHIRHDLPKTATVLEAQKLKVNGISRRSRLLFSLGECKNQQSTLFDRLLGWKCYFEC